MPHDMQFCEACQNMMFIQNDADGVHYMCPCCNNRVNFFDKASHCISRTSLKQKEAIAKSVLNENVLADPTLPCTAMIACPNKECSRGEEPNRVVYINYDSNNLKFVYSCLHCKHSWTIA